VKTEKEYCPGCGSELQVKCLSRNTRFRDENISYTCEVSVCPHCGLEIGTPAQTGAAQRAISDAWREKTGLLTGREIREQRLRINMSHEILAEKTGVNVREIRRWEAGIIQTAAMDQVLRAVLFGDTGDQSATGA